MHCMLEIRDGVLVLVFFEGIGMVSVSVKIINIYYHCISIWEFRYFLGVLVLVWNGMDPWAPPDFSESRKLLGFYEEVT